MADADGRAALERLIEVRGEDYAGLSRLLGRIVAATASAFAQGIRLMVTRASQHAKRLVWLHYARWLVAALTFQLAADIIETSIRTDWQSIGRLGAVAVIRTFLNYFLERDLAELRERESEA